MGWQFSLIAAAIGGLTKMTQLWNASKQQHDVSQHHGQQGPIYPASHKAECNVAYSGCRAMSCSKATAGVRLNKGEGRSLGVG